MLHFNLSLQETQRCSLPHTINCGLLCGCPSELGYINAKTIYTNFQGLQNANECKPRIKTEIIKKYFINMCHYAVVGYNNKTTMFGVRNSLLALLKVKIRSVLYGQVNITRIWTPRLSGNLFEMHECTDGNIWPELSLSSYKLFLFDRVCWFGFIFSLDSGPFPGLDYEAQRWPWIVICKAIQQILLQWD